MSWVTWAIVAFFTLAAVGAQLRVGKTPEPVTQKSANISSIYYVVLIMIVLFAALR